MVKDYWLVNDRERYLRLPHGFVTKYKQGVQSTPNLLKSSKKYVSFKQNYNW